MALVQKTLEYSESYNDLFVVSKWTLAQTDVGDKIQSTGYADRSVQIHGTFGGGSCIIEGSNDGVNFFTLTDPQGNDLVLNQAKIEQISEITRYIRPNISGGSGATSIVVTLLMRRGYR